MSQLAPAKIRLWIEMWKEEVMSSVPTEDLQQKFEESQVQKGRTPQKIPNKLHAEGEGGHLL